MARDFDFRKRTTPRPVSKPPVPAAKPPIPVNQLPPPKVLKELPPPKSPLWIWIMVIVLAVAAAIFFYYQSLKPAPVSHTPTPTASAAPSAKTTTKTSELATVTLYNSGAGDVTTNTFAQTLKDHNYSVENLGDSEFQLDQTYIWYQPQYQTDAEAIQKLLDSKKVALREYAGTGPYKILIQLGP